MIDEKAFEAAKLAFAKEPATWEVSLRAAISAYMREAFRPGELIVSEPLPSQRDYRKELWVDVAVAVAAGPRCLATSDPSVVANQTLEAFDKTFGEKQ